MKLRESGPRDVLVVDAGGEDRAVAGELFATVLQRLVVLAHEFGVGKLMRFLLISVLSLASLLLGQFR